jgi:hypothetical protein
MTLGDVAVSVVFMAGFLAGVGSLALLLMVWVASKKG